MFTNKDIKYRSIFVIDCISEKQLRVCNGELLLEDTLNKKTLTKLPFPKILALIVIGHISITTPLIDKCRKNNVALVVVTPSLRPVFFWSLSAEANFLLRKRQYEYPKDNISIAKHLVYNKIINQYENLKNSRYRDFQTKQSMALCLTLAETLENVYDYTMLMGIEGRASKAYFSAYFQNMPWKGRQPRIKADYINTSLDIGYTLLFNFIEIYIRMFGFDPYIGVYHRLWFKRKSLICDLVEPFRCIIDKTLRKAINRNQIKETDFDVYKGMYQLKREKNRDYCLLFYTELVAHKIDIFKYIQNYYRCFMQGKAISSYPLFIC